MYGMINPPSDERNPRDNKYLVEGGFDAAHDVLWKTATGQGKHLISDLPKGLLAGKPVSGFMSAYRYGLQGAALPTLAMVAYSFGHAPKGRKVARATGTLTGALSGATIGGYLAGPLGAIAGGIFLSGPVERAVSGTINKFVDVGRELRMPNLGGRYSDTEMAYTMRQRAAMEIGNSLMNARQHLGNEAMLSHS